MEEEVGAEVEEKREEMVEVGIIIGGKTFSEEGEGIVEIFDNLVKLIAFGFLKYDISIHKLFGL